MLPESKREFFGRKLGELFEYLNIKTIDGLLVISLILLLITLVQTVRDLRSGKEERINKNIEFVDYEVIFAALFFLFFISF